MNSKSFSGADLEKALTEGALTQAQATLIGMVKPSEKSGHVSFSQAGCDAWVDLPTDMIERADQEGQRPCRDHLHPVMTITLKEPKDAQGKILLDLLAQTAPIPSEAQHVDELRTYPTSTPETGVSFRSFGQNSPPQPWMTGGTGFEGADFAPGRQFGQQQLGFGGFTVKCYYYGPFLGRWCCLYFNGRWINCAEMRYNQFSL